VKKVYILDDKELYGVGVARGFHERCKELKIAVLGHESINPTRQVFTVLLKAIAKLNPDLIYFGGTTQSGGPAIARDAVAAGLKCPLLVPDGCYEQNFIEAAKTENLNGRCYVTIGGVEPSQLTGKGADFVKAYRAKYRVEPESYAVYGYEAASVVLAAIKQVGKKDREAVRRAVVGTKDFEGALGKWSFDANGDTTLQQLTVSKVEKGKFSPIKVLSKTPVK
jgi:branched-chain amino acid transport system substrate-binding protein